VAPCTPGVSTKTICPRSLLNTPVIRLRVVCGLGVTMASFSPTMRLSKVDLPTFGRPRIATRPARTGTLFMAAVHINAMLPGVMRILLLGVAVLVTGAAQAAEPGPSGATSGLSWGTAPDGALDVRDGGASIAHLALKTPPLRRGQPVLREVSVEGHRVAELRVPVRGTSGAEVWIARLDRPDHPVIWSGLTGARDADGETSIWAEASPERVVEYQTAAQVTRCDGQP